MAGNDILFEILNGQQFEEEIVEALKQELANGAEVNAKDEQGWTILHRAISNNQLTIVKLLVQKGADINAENASGLSATRLATREGNWSILKWLVEERGAKIPLVDDRHGEEVERILRRLRNTDAFAWLNDETDAVLILGNTDSATDVLTEYLVKYDGNCDYLIGYDDVLGNSTAPSPSVLVNDKTDVIYYGCSDFGDTTNPSDDFASGYFLRKVIDYVHSVKIVFSVNYKDLKNQKRFIKFLTSATNFIDDLKKLNGSISLVVTKSIDEVSYEDEETTLSHVGDLLGETKRYIESKIKPKSEEAFSSNLTDLVDIFLVKRADDFVNLGVFRVERMSGRPVSKYGGRKSAEVVINNSVFVFKDQDDFHYSISDGSKYLVYNLIERINIGVTFDVINVAQELQKYFLTEVDKSTNLHKLQEKLNAESAILTQMKQDIVLSANPVDLVEIIIRHVEKLKISISGGNLKSINQWGHCMEFLEIANGQKYQATPWDWVKSVAEVSKYLDDANRWYDFLLDLYDKFSTYQMQNDKRKYNVANLDDWGKFNANQGINIVRNNWKKFLDLMQQYNVKQYSYVKDMSADKLKLKDLNHVLELSFKREAQISCSGVKRIAKGNYVFLSDIIKKGCYKNVYYQVFALNTVFIDMNLNQCNLQGVILAPKWEIVGERVLGLTSEGEFLGIGAEYENYNNFAFTFTKGQSNASRINLIGAKAHVLTTTRYFTKSIACVERNRLPNREQISYNIDDYKSYVRENLIDNVKQQPLTEFVKDVEENPDVIKLYDVLGFVRELQELENHFYRLSNEVDFLPFYQSLLSRMSEYAEHLKPQDKSMQRQKILAYAHAATLSKITNLKYGTNSNLVIDIKEYLDLVKANIKELGEIDIKSGATAKNFDDINKKGMIEQYRNSYKTEIDKKIEEANYFIETYILPEINRLSDRIEKELQDLLAEIDEIKHDIEKQKQQLKKIERKLEEQIRLRALLGFFKIIGSFLSIFGPIGQIAGAVVNVVAGVAETFVPDSFEEFNKLEQFTLPEGTDVERALQKREVKPERRELEATVNHRRRRSDTSDAISATGGSITDLINNAKGDEQKLQVVREALKKSEMQIRQLEDFKVYVRSKVTPWVKGILNGLQGNSRNLQGKSQSALDVQRWHAQQMIKDMKFYLVEATKGFKVQKSFKRSLEKLDDAMNTLVNIFDRIQNYEDQKRLADYIADISSVQFANINIDDVKLMNATNNLERIITSNVLLGRYDTAVNNFKQFTFPFADYYLEDFSMLSVLTEDGNVQTLVDNAVKRLGLMKSALVQSSTTINRRYDKHIHKSYFNGESKIVGPFYVWNNNEYKELIFSLLGGEEVALKADIMQTTGNRNAVKFDFVELFFRTINSTKQEELDTKLKYFEISMTHRGNSYYRCGSKYYIINTDSVTVTYSLQKTGDGKPISANVVYEKLKSGDLLLSPYAMWTIKLTPTTLAFKELRKYAREIDLVLIGHGQYLNKDADVCDHDLSKYYRVDKTMSEITFADEETPRVLESESYRHTCASSGATFNSPINEAIKWFKGTFSHQNDRQFVTNPVEFYNQVDSSLAIAPVLLHLWNQFFNKKPTSSTKIEVEGSKVKLWHNVLSHAQNLVDSVKEVLGVDNSELNWYIDALETRKESVIAIGQGKQVPSADVDDLEKNLVAFYVDLEEDLKYNKNFNGSQNHKSVQEALIKLAHSLTAVPHCSRLLNLENTKIGQIDCQGQNIMYEGIRSGNRYDILGVTAAAVAEKYTSQLLLL